MVFFNEYDLNFFFISITGCLRLLTSIRQHHKLSLRMRNLNIDVYENLKRTCFPH